MICNGDIPIFSSLVVLTVKSSTDFLETSKESLKVLDMAYFIGNQFDISGIIRPIMIPYKV